jgi:hypothetical protein
MDHTTAIRLQAAEKYLLGELDPSVRDEYEEHYFDCSECALDLRAAAAFAANSRQVFQNDAVAAIAAERAGRRAPARPSFIERFRWTFAAAPTFAALVLAVVVTYQGTVLIPSLKHASGSTISLPDANSRILPLGAALAKRSARGENQPANDIAFSVRSNEPFFVKFDFTPNTILPAYICQLRDASGQRILLQVPVSGDMAGREYQLAVPGGLLPAPGIYQVAILGADQASGQPLPGDKPQTFAITIAFRQ